MGIPLQVFCNHKNLKVLEYVEYWTNGVSNMTTILRLNPSCIGLSPKEDHRICRFSKVCLMMQQSLCDSLLITAIQQHTLMKCKKYPALKCTKLKCIKVNITKNAEKISSLYWITLPACHCLVDYITICHSLIFFLQIQGSFPVSFVINLW